MRITWASQWVNEANHQSEVKLSEQSELLKKQASKPASYPANQPTNWPTNKPTNQPTNQPILHSWTPKTQPGGSNSPWLCIKCLVVSVYFIFCFLGILYDLLFIYFLKIIRDFFYSMAKICFYVKLNYFQQHYIAYYAHTWCFVLIANKVFYQKQWIVLRQYEFT